MTAEEQGLPEYPNIEDFRERKDGQPLPLKKEAINLYAQLLLNYHTQRSIADMDIQVLNPSRNREGDVEQCLYWGVSSKEDPDWFPSHWCLEQFSCDMDSVMASITDVWLRDCHRYAELKYYCQLLANQNRAHKIVKDYLLAYRAKNIGVLRAFDDIKGTGRFKLGGEVWRAFLDSEDKQWKLQKELEEERGFKLLMDTGLVANDKEYAAGKPVMIRRLRKLWPDYDAPDDPTSLSGNHAIDIWFRQHGKAFLPTAKREATFMSGGGSNGKSLILKMFADIVLAHPTSPLLSPAMTVPGAAFADMRNNGSGENKQKGDRSRMQGARVIYATEMPNTRLDGDFIKPFTTGEMCVGGGNYKDNTPLFFHASAFIAGNNPPRFYEDTHGIHRRFIVIRFNQKFDDPDNNASEDESYILNETLNLRPVYLRHLLETIKFMVECQQMDFPEDLPGLMQEDREAIMDKGRDPIKLALEDFVKVADGKPDKKLLLGGQSERHGYKVGKKNYYGIMLAVRLMVDKAGRRMDYYDRERIEGMVTQIGGDLYKGNKKQYKNLEATPEMVKFVQEETRDPNASAYLWDWDGGKELEFPDRSDFEV